MNKLEAFLDNAFQGVPPTRKVRELKDELLSNITEKYNDEIARGLSEADAFKVVIDNMGDLRELVASVREPGLGYDPVRTKKSALVVSSAVAMYIISPFTVPLFFAMGIGDIAAATPMFLLIALATAMLIYNGMTTPKYTGREDTVVEDFKEWRSTNNSTREAFRSFKSGYWGLITVAYFMASLYFGHWGTNVLIFVFGSALLHIIKGFISLRGE